MIVALTLTLLASLIQYFAFGPVLGLVPQLTILVLVWLSGTVTPRTLAAVAAINGLLVAVLVPGPVAALAIGYMLFGLILMLSAPNNSTHPSFDSKLLDQSSTVGLAMLGSLCVTLLPIAFTVPIGYMSIAVANSLLTSIVTAGLAYLFFKIDRRWVNSGH